MELLSMPEVKVACGLVSWKGMPSENGVASGTAGHQEPLRIQGSFTFLHPDEESTYSQ